jgi:3-oxoadipate enol-lactonase
VTDGVLLIHAWPLDARIWRGQIEALGGGETIVAPSLPGFGGTEPAGNIMTMAAAAGRCLDELDRAGVDRAVVCGLSVGGYVAFELWRRARDRFAGLVLANTRAIADTPEAAANRRTLAARLRSEGIEFFVAEPPALLAADAPGDLREFVRDAIAEQPAEAIAAALLGMAERPDSTPDLAGIDVPTLVITSDLDALVPTEQSLSMAAAIPGASTELIAGVGHLTNLEAPEAFNGALRRHVEACSLG